MFKDSDETVCRKVRVVCGVMRVYLYNLTPLGGDGGNSGSSNSIGDINFRYCDVSEVMTVVIPEQLLNSVLE